MFDSCERCGHTFRHRSVAERHICCTHSTSASRLSNVSLPVYHFTSDDDLISSDQACSDIRPPAVTSTTMTVVEPSLEQTKRSAANLDSGAKYPQSSCDATSTTNFSDVAEDRSYWLRLVRESASTASSDCSEILGTGDSDLLGPPMNPVLSQQQATCVQSCPSDWNRPFTSADSHRGETTTCSSSVWLCNSLSSTTDSSSLNCWPLPSLSTDDLKLKGSGMDNVRPAHGHYGLLKHTGSELFEKEGESTHVNHLGSTAAAAERFACPLCSLSYKRVADLNRHMKQKHWTSLSAFSSSSTSSVNSADWLTAARDRPLNLAMRNANFGRQLQPGTQLGGKDAPQDHPLDLSTTSKTLNEDDSSGGQSPECTSDRVDDWRSSSSQLLPPFLPRMSSVSLQNTTAGKRGNVTALSASTIPSFYASFTRFMENAYRPLWKSYLDGMLGRNATAVRSRNHCGDERRTDDDLKRSTEKNRRSAMNSEFPRPLSSTDDNNNTLKCDPTGRSTALLCTADASQTSVPTAVKGTAHPDNSTGRKHIGGGSWGQCPLCPFVCPHPLVMRRHLDLHDEPELQRTSTSQSDRQTAVGAAAAITCRTSLERGVVEIGGADGRQGSYLDVAYRLDSPCGVGRWSNPSTWTSTFVPQSNAVTVPTVSAPGHIPRNQSLFRGPWPGWLPARPFPESDARTDDASESAKSAGLPRQTVVPFPETPDKVAETWRAKDWKRQLCDSSRSTYVKKHDKMRPSGGHVATVTASAVDTWTMNSHAKKARLRVPVAAGAASWWTGWTPLNGHLLGSFPGWQHSAAAADTPAAVTPPSSHMRAADFKVTSPLLRYVQIPLGGPDQTVDPGLRQVRGLRVVGSGPD